MEKPELPKKLTEKSIADLPVLDDRYDVPDHEIRNLYITVYPSGKKTWVYRYRASGKNKRYRIGDGSIRPAAARAAAKSIAGDIAKGLDPNAEKQEKRRQEIKSREGTLKTFIENRYEPWVIVERKSGAETVQCIKSAFGFLIEKPMESITHWEIEKWRKERHQKGLSPSTTNRQIAALRACISKAVEWGVIDIHPLQGLKPSKVDKSVTPRIISDEQDKQLRVALRERDAALRRQRLSANEWRTDRHYDLLPEYGHYVDHLEPMVLLALNTGMRRGEILQLRWVDVNSERLVVRGSTAKSSQTREIPLSAEAKDIFKSWNSNSEWVFPGTGEHPITTIKRSWGGIKKAAGLPGLRFHDLRHTFATRILQRGTDIRTVSALLGHADISTTAKYLHATDDSKKKAVDLL